MRRGWIIYTAGEFQVLPDLDGLTTIQRAVLSPFTNASSVTGPRHGAIEMSADEAAATGVTYTYDSTEGKRHLAAIARQYEPLIAELLTEIESADRAGDVASSAAAAATLEQLKRLMAADLKKEKDAQRTQLVLAVQAETKCLLRAIRAIESVFECIGAHLWDRVDRGFEVVYEPRPDERVKWIGSAPCVREEVGA